MTIVHTFLLAFASGGLASKQASITLQEPDLHECAERLRRLRLEDEAVGELEDPLLMLSEHEWSLRRRASLEEASAAASQGGRVARLDPGSLPCQSAEEADVAVRKEARHDGE